MQVDDWMKLHNINLPSLHVAAKLREIEEAKVRKLRQRNLQRQLDAVERSHAQTNAEASAMSIRNRGSAIPDNADPEAARGIRNGNGGY